MNITFLRDIAITIAVVGALGFAFTQMPDYRHEHEWQRQQTLDDRKYSDDARKAALTEMRACYKEAEDRNSGELVTRMFPRSYREPYSLSI